MDIGINLPVMVPGLDRDTVRAWCRSVDALPYCCLAAGERYHFPNPELTVTLSMAAAWTERVPILYNVLVLPLHHEVLAAKQIATLDVLSGGRVRVGLGVGAREEDFVGLGVPMHGQRLAEIERKVERMKRLWAGEKAFDKALGPLEPAPLSRPAPELLAGALLPGAIRRAARWADGILGFSFGMAEPELQAQFEAARAAWKEAGRPRPPRLVTGCWVALGDDGPAQMASYLRRYLNFFGDAVEYMIPTVPTTSAEGLLEALARARDLGADEVVLAPTTKDPDEPRRIADLVF